MSEEMVPPVFLDKAEPAIFTSLTTVAKEVSAAAKRVGLHRQLIELVNLRVSQLNGCAFCLDVHHRRALAAGEDPRRLAVLSAWGDSSLFTEAEQACLRLAEAITTVPDQQTRERAEHLARQVLGDEAYAVVAWVAVTMNAFNRVSVTSHHPVTAGRGTEPRRAHGAG